MTKFSPGPWSLGSDGKVRDNQQYWVHCPVASPQGMHAQANARLIAAAPDLLAALEDVRQSCLFSDDDGTIGVTPDPHISDRLFDKICDAIAKARPQATSSYLNRTLRTFEQAVRDSEGKS
ncbi:hypothetical protein LCGC14_1614050 [marine sediment metagenome]|uniref:Uncharacterized protein n=1 Tax=marine sediment metagenome TaxID=412755 RepID=A0A0F9KN56_9ZZZZ